MQQVYHKALTIRQPWASMIIAGLKTIEVRNWRTDYRGPIWVHAARQPDRIIRQLNPGLLARLENFAKWIGWPEAFPARCIIGQTEIIDCRPLAQNDQAAACCACEGQFGLILANTLALARPHSIAGALSFWHVPDSVADLLA